MPLVPAQDDPNRKAELKRMTEDPQSFDQDPIKPTHPNSAYINPHNSGLVEDLNKPSGQKEPEPAPAQKEPAATDNTPAKKGK